jgi:sulfite exporter TauE/SafE|tara:strand:+ start:1440 stop:1748 length:309 start_codon:yes stop_codon:yes gene_type:complete
MGKRTEGVYLMDKSIEMLIFTFTAVFGVVLACIGSVVEIQEGDRFLAILLIFAGMSLIMIGCGELYMLGSRYCELEGEELERRFQELADRLEKENLDSTLNK